MADKDTIKDISDLGSNAQKQLLDAVNAAGGLEQLLGKINSRYDDMSFYLKDIVKQKKLVLELENSYGKKMQDLALNENKIRKQAEKDRLIASGNIRSIQLELNTATGEELGILRDKLKIQQNLEKEASNRYKNTRRAIYEELSIERKKLELMEREHKAQLYRNALDQDASDLGNKIFGKLEALIKKLPGGNLIFQHLFGGIKDKFSKDILKIGIDFQKNIGEKGSDSGKLVAGAFKDVGKAGMQAMAGIGKALMANPWLLLIGLLVMAVQQFLEMDKAAESFRKETGLTKNQMGALRDEVEKVAIQNAHLGVTFESAYKSAAALTATFGSNVSFAKKNVEFVALMSSNLGIAEGDSAKVLQNFMGMSGMSSETAQNTALYVVSLSKAGGVAPKKVMEDIAKLSGKQLANFRGNVIALAKAAVEAKRLGSSVSDVSNAMDSLLDFETSFNNEMELSTLLGKNVNLQAMRLAAYRGDAVTVLKEQNKLIDETGDLTKQNKFVVDSMAKSMGISVDTLMQMNSMRVIENELQTAARKGDKEAKKELEERKRYEDLQKENSKDIQKSAAQRSAEMRRQNEMQSQQAEMMNELKSAWVEISSILVPIVKILMGLLMPVLKLIGGLVRGIMKPFQESKSKFDYSKLLERMATLFGAIGEIVGYVLGLVSKFMNPITYILIGMEKIYERTSEYFGDLGKMWDDGLNRIVAGLESVGPMITSTITGWFDSAWNSISSWFGNSPSELGLSIVKGLESISGMMIDVLLSPWTTAWNLIKKIPFVGKLFGGAGGDMSIQVSKEAEVKSPVNDMVNTISGQLSNIITILQSMAIGSIAEGAISGVGNVASKTTSGIKEIFGLGNTEDPTTETKTKETLNNKDVVDKLEELISLMKAGGISVNLDGRKVSSQLAIAVNI